MNNTETFTQSENVKGTLAHASKQLHLMPSVDRVGMSCERIEARERDGVYLVDRVTYHAPFGSQAWKEARREPETMAETLQGARSYILQEITLYDHHTGQGAQQRGDKAQRHLSAVHYNGIDELITAAMLQREQKQFNGYEVSR
jgi:hypothetical protein